jgi:ribose transport system ATP-binding protein
MAEVSALEMRGIRKVFGGTVAVDGVDLKVTPGEVCALVGQNGAGKSTLMSILAGATRPDAGEMHLGGTPFAPHSPLEARHAGVAMIYQELSLAPHLSVAENLLLGVEPTRRGIVNWEGMRATTARVLARLGHSEIDPNAPVSSLSVAGQQLVEIGRALAVGCRVLVLDEPTSSLGREDVRRLFELIRQLKAEQHAIVYISHFLEEVKEIADRIVVLRDGRVVGESAAGGISSKEIVRLMVGRGVEDLFPRSARSTGETVLRVEASGEDAAGFELRRGEILGIAGLLGSGRTRLLRSVFDRFGGWRKGIGFVSEDRKGEGLAMTLDLANNLTLSRLRGLGPPGLVVPRRQEATAQNWMSRLGIKARSAWQRVAELSGGNQQKVAIARLLHHDVDVLLLDEPTRGIDVASKAQIYALLDELVSRERPKAILLVSSYFPELLGLCDRIAVMHRGRLGAARPVSEWTEHALILAATGADRAA